MASGMAIKYFSRSAARNFCSKARLELKEANSRAMRFVLAKHPGDTDPESFRGAIESDFLEAGKFHPTSNFRAAIRPRTSGAASPDDRCSGRAQHRPGIDRGANVIIADISEHAAAQHQIRGNRAFIRLALPGVAARDFDGSWSVSARALRQYRTQLNQPPAHVSGTRVMAENAQ